MADAAVPNCVGDGDKQQSNADVENLTQYVNWPDVFVLGAHVDNHTTLVL